MNPTQARREVAAQLAERREEIERAILTYVRSISDGARSVNPEYAHGIGTTVSAMVGYAIESVESGERFAPEIPLVALTQARLAARSGIEVGIVVQRYIAGYTLFGDFVDAESEKLGLTLAETTELRRVQGGRLGLFITAVTGEHERESRSRRARGDDWRTERISRLLNGENVDTSDLNYNFDNYQLGIVARGRGASSAIKELATELDCLSLVAEKPEGQIWAWLGRRTPPNIDRVEDFVSKHWPADSSLAIGEIGLGLAGWRLTHQQARAGFLVILQRGDRFFRYGDDPLLVTLLQDSLLAESFQQMYMVPLSNEYDGGRKVRATLRAYFDAERNAASAAKTLGVNRQTVKNHLQLAEERLKRPLSTCMAELEACLRLEGLKKT